MAEAAFEIAVDGVAQDVQWTHGKAAPAALSSFAIFDSRCARAYLDSEDDFSYVPYGLDVFEGLAKVCKQLKTLIETEHAQSAAFRNPVRTAPKPMPPKPVYTPPPAPTVPDIDWDNLSDPEVLSDAYLSGLTIREMSQKSGLSESWLREKLRSMDLIF